MARKPTKTLEAIREFFNAVDKSKYKKVSYFLFRDENGETHTITLNQLNKYINDKRKELKINGKHPRK